MSRLVNVLIILLVVQTFPAEGIKYVRWKSIEIKMSNEFGKTGTWLV